MKLLKNGLLTVFIISLSINFVIASGIDQDTKATLDQFRIAFEEMMLKEEIAQVAQWMSPEIRLMTTRQPTMLGKKNALLYYESFFKRLDLKNYSRSKVQQLDLGKKVIEIGTIKMTLLYENKSEEINAKYMDIWKRNSDGTLSIETLAWNYDKWVEMGDVLKFPEVPNVRTALNAHHPIEDDISFEINALVSYLEDVIIEGDPQLWASFYDPEGIRIGNYTPLCQGTACLQAYFDKHVNEVPIFESLDIRPEYIEQLGDYVLEYSSGLVSWRYPDASGVSTSKGIRLWKRSENGPLKLLYLISLYDY